MPWPEIFVQLNRILIKVCRQLPPAAKAAKPPCLTAASRRQLTAHS